MQLKKIILTNFKNYELQDLSCSPTLNCFLGKNGMGKTNLLDAVYFLCMGKSYFNLPDYQVCHHDTNFFRLEGQFSIDEKKEKIVAKVQARKRKVFERNDVPYQKLSEHVGLLPVVFIAPDDTEIIREGSEIRRRFLDNTLSQIDQEYLNHLIKYNNLLKQRNAALKKMTEQGLFNADLLEVYDHQMLEPGKLIFQKRQAFILEFHTVLQQYYTRISGGQEAANCLYQSQLHQFSFEELLKQSQEKDRILQRTTTGIHRDDLKFTLDGYSLKKFASQGQLKSFVLSLKLAQYQILRTQKKMLPLLLLDDIFDKLDNQRVESLLQLLQEEAFGQLFLTDTDPERVNQLLTRLDIDSFQFSVIEGTITPINT